MNGNFILIFDKRVEISNKYKKIIEQKHCAKVQIVSETDIFFNEIQNAEPDMILISESTNENFTKLCTKMRELHLQFRPVIILLSKSSFSEDKAMALDAGADDFLSEPIEAEEFLARINAHLRRTVEENSNILTKLPASEYSKKIIRRTIKKGNDWAMLLIGFDNFPSYKEIYGQIPANKILQAFSAILKATLEYDDFVGQLSDETFLIATSAFKAEKLADYLNYAFDSISSRFYSDNDASRGYILLNGENKAGCKIPIMTTSIGIINSELISYKNEIEVINALTKVQKLAKTIVGSSKIIDRPLLTSEDFINFIEEKNIVVVEQDEDLSYLLETTLRIQGFNPVVFNDYPSDITEILKSSPSLVILDSGRNDGVKGLELCKKIREKTKQNIKIIFTDTLHQKDEILSSGADLYLPKPYELMDLFQWIYKLLD